MTADSEEDIVGNELEITIKVGHSTKGSYPNIVKIRPDKSKKVKAKAIITEEADIEDDEDLEIDDEVDIEDDEDLEVEDDDEGEEELEED